MDADASTRLGIPGAELMERAGAGASVAMMQAYPDRLRSVWIFGGLGQNGGDAWVVARTLMHRGINPQVVLLGAREKITGDAKPNFDALAALGLDVIDIRVEADLARVQQGLNDASLIVDGLFGTGLDRPVAGAALALIAMINAQQAPIVALDMPSGVDANSGAVLGEAVNASLTTTFGAHKRGLHQAPGRAHAGRIVVVPIGVAVPSTCVTTLVDASVVAHGLAPRASDAHKGDSGRVLVVAGSEGHTGAALLAGRGAMRAGAGLVTLAPRPSGFAAIESKVVELMTVRVASESASALLELKARAENANAVVVGPGLGLDADARNISRGLALSLTCPTVLDADALTALGDDVAMLQGASGARVLTPHPGEAARLLGITNAEVQRDRFRSARALAERSGHVVILKGACSIIASPDGAIAVCDRGTPALAVGGTGDVLAGALAAILCQAPVFLACQIATWLHAVAGEVAAVGDRGLLAREVADSLPRALVLARNSGAAA